MPTVLKQDIRTNIAQIVYNALRSKFSRPYFFFGRTLPWDDEQVAPNPSAARDYELETRKHIVGMKALTTNDVSYAIVRQDWTAGTVYDRYDDRYSVNFVAPSGATDIADAQMFVLTDEFNIYKCIDNNSNRPSTVKPTGRSSGFIGPLEDGYIWKYMDTLDVIQRTKFLTSEQLPISDSVDARYFVSNLVPVVNNGGTGYDANNTVIQILGDGELAAFEPVINENGQIIAVTVLNPGIGYTQAEAVIQTPDPNLPQGSGAEIAISVSYGDLENPQADVQLAAVDGSISYIDVINSGIGYTTATAVVEGNGSDAELDPIIVDGVITKINILNRGSGYTNARVVITGDGQGAEADVVLSPVGGHGKSLVQESFVNALAFHLTTVDEINQGFLIDNDYRQAGLIFNPYKFKVPGATREFFISDYGSTCYAVEVEGIDKEEYSLDQTLTMKTTEYEYTIVAIDDLEDNSQNVIGTRFLLQTLTDNAPEDGDEFIDDEGQVIFTIPTEGVSEPTIDKYSGSMAFIINRTAFRKSAEQIVNLRAFVQF